MLYLSDKWESALASWTSWLRCIINSIGLQLLNFISLLNFDCLLLFFNLLVNVFLPLDRLFSQLRECLFHIGVILSGCLNKWHIPVFLAEPLQWYGRYLTIIILHIKFIAHDNEWECIGHCHHTLRKERLFPISKIFKWLRICDVVDK